MHLLAATPGVVSDGSEAVDLGQTPGHIVVLSAADTELAALAAAQDRADRPDRHTPSLRLGNFLQLRHHMSVDLYVDTIVSHAKLVVVRMLGGASYWPYGIEQIASVCRRRGIAFAAIPGDDQPDPDLIRYSTLPADDIHRIWQYLVHGGPANADNFLAFAAALLGGKGDWQEPVRLLTAGLYWPGIDAPDLSDLRGRWHADAPVAAIVFYRALVQSGNLEPVDALVGALQDRGLNPLPIYVQSLKESVSAGIVSATFADAPPGVILNATGFAVSTPGADRTETPLDIPGCPILQTVFAATTEEIWAASDTGLIARDIAMNVALPEVDGRVLSRAVAFKSEARFDAATQTSVVKHLPSDDRVAFVADLAAAWAKLRGTPAKDRRIALVLANYPNRDGRIGNGVGLDTPAGTLTLLRAMAQVEYRVEDLPADGNALVDRLLAGPTNAEIQARIVEETLSLADYQVFFSGLPQSVRDAVAGR